MELINAKFLVNRYDSAPCTLELQLDGDDSIGLVKQKCFGDALAANLSVRIVYCGRCLNDGDKIASLSSTVPLVFVVFITKPNARPSTQTEEQTVWKWSTPAWIALIATLWCYKYNISDSFSCLATGILYGFTVAVVFAVLLPYLSRLWVLPVANASEQTRTQS